MESDEDVIARLKNELEKLVSKEAAYRLNSQHLFGMGAGVYATSKRRCRDHVVYLLRRAMAEIRQ